jgi:hypothetical protein
VALSAAALVLAWRLVAAFRRWRHRAAVDRRREEDESRDWLDTGERGRRCAGE